MPRGTQPHVGEGFRGIYVGEFLPPPPAHVNFLELTRIYGIDFAAKTGNKGVLPFFFLSPRTYLNSQKKKKPAVACAVGTAGK